MKEELMILLDNVKLLSLEMVIIEMLLLLNRFNN